MNCLMASGSSFGRCYPSRCGGGSDWTTAGSLNGIVWKFRTGVAWRDVPERYGPWATFYTRFRRWARDGTFDRILRAAQARADAAGDVDWLVAVDSTVLRAHQNAAGARNEGFATRLSDGSEAD
ncbi:transposase [Streptomyces sp. WAC05458]|nr:transposase [Streptomyces sp. WAC05458]